MPAVPPMPIAIEAAADTALIECCDTLSLSTPPTLTSSSTKLWPSGASSDQLWPGTSVVSLSLSTSCQRAVLAKFSLPSGTLLTTSAVSDAITI